MPGQPGSSRSGKETERRVPAGIPFGKRTRKIDYTPASSHRYSHPALLPGTDGSSDTVA